MASILSTQAMLARLAISKWSARRFDRKVTQSTNDAHNAAHDAGRYNKALLSKGALSTVTRIEGEARAEHYRLTLPWRDDGARILPSANFMEYANAMNAKQAEFAQAVREFVAGYPAFKSDAKARLNGMYQESDYPHESLIKSRFGFRYDVDPVPAADDFRVDLSEGNAALIRERIEENNREALAAAMRDPFERVADRVAAMVDRLAAYKPAQGKGDKSEGVFRDSLVENIRDLVAVLPGLNLTNDPDLAAIADRMRAELCAHDADALRDSDNIRASVAASAGDILAKVQSILG